MTSYASDSVTCASCGAVFQISVLNSTNEFGSPDLDLRPPMMKRATMGAWIFRCPECGYCAHDVSKWDDRFRAPLESVDYRAQLDNADYPELASTFICAGMLSQTIGENGEAAIHYLRSAWVLDDAGNDLLARELRNRAADLMLDTLAKGQSFASNTETSEGVAVDCLRRAGRPDEAQEIVRKALEREGMNDVLRKVFEFQRRLLTQNDTAAHTVKEAMEENSPK